MAGEMGLLGSGSGISRGVVEVERVGVERGVWEVTEETEGVEGGVGREGDTTADCTSGERVGGGVGTVAEADGRMTGVVDGGL